MIFGLYEVAWDAIVHCCVIGHFFIGFCVWDTSAIFICDVRFSWCLPLEKRLFGNLNRHVDYIDAFVISFWGVFCTCPRRTADERRRRVFRSLLGILVERC